MYVPEGVWSLKGVGSEVQNFRMGRPHFEWWLRGHRRQVKPQEDEGLEGLQEVKVQEMAPVWEAGRWEVLGIIVAYQRSLNMD